MNDDCHIEIKAKKPVLTYAFIAVNILVWILVNGFALRLNVSTNLVLGIFGQKDNVRIIAGEYWRFLTPVFLHANHAHLLVNCYSLYLIGTTVERIFGHGRFLAIYLIAGIIGNIASFMFLASPGVGASGSIFGLMGALLYFSLVKPALSKACFGNRIVTAIAINLVYGFIIPGIDNSAHLGGLAGGFLVSGSIGLNGKKSWYLNKQLYLILTVVLTISGLYFGFNNKQNNMLMKVDRLERLYREKRWQEAERAGEEILAASLSNRRILAQTLWYLSQVEFYEGKFEEAMQHAGELRQIDPGSGHYLLGKIYFELEKYEAAREELLEARRLRAEFGDVDSVLMKIETELKKNK